MMYYVLYIVRHTLYISMGHGQDKTSMQGDYDIISLYMDKVIHFNVGFKSNGFAALSSATSPMFMPFIRV